MQRMLKKIGEISDDLDNSQLCQWLREEKNITDDRLNFVPSMLFFVLGFKDILNAMSSEEPKTPLEVEVNTHCAEDVDHWRWYLEDLKKLGFVEKSWGSEVNDSFINIWSDESAISRDVVYNVIFEIKKHNDPLMSLVIIELLEAAFGVFIRNMLVPIERSGIYEKLDYFGRKHVEKEAAHSRGSWTTGVRVDHHSLFDTHVLTDDQYETAGSLIDKISPQIDLLFDHWYAMRNNYARNTNIEEQSAEVA